MSLRSKVNGSATAGSPLLVRAYERWLAPPLTDPHKSTNVKIEYNLTFTALAVHYQLRGTRVNICGYAGRFCLGPDAVPTQSLDPRPPCYSRIGLPIDPHQLSRPLVFFFTISLKSSSRTISPGR